MDACVSATNLTVPSCPYCDKAFAFAHSAKRHIREGVCHEAQQAMDGELRALSYKKRKVRHEVEATRRSGYFECGRCGITLTDKYNMRNHYRAVHKQEPPQGL
jgi:hypothetical protein